MRHVTLASLLVLSLTACSFSGPDADDTVENTSAGSSDMGAEDNSMMLNDSMSFVDASSDQMASGSASMQPDDGFEAPEYMQLQVVLDAMGFSPGIIDGKMGLSTRNAISGFQQQAGLDVTGKLDEATQAKLQTAMRTNATRIVTIPPEYGQLTFTEIPEDSKAQAKMEKLGYESMWEKLAERFHTTKEVLQSLNPQIEMADTASADKAKPMKDKAPAEAKTKTANAVNSGTSETMTGKRKLAVGTQLRVPNIGADKIAKGSVDDEKWASTLVSLGVGSEQPQAAKVVVDKSDGTLKAFDGAGKLIAAFTATMGSSHDPLPLGNWDILGKAYNPPFSLDPTLMWDMPDDGEKLSLPPGPNGPVGVVWIDLSKEHYGIHGTPDPETIGRAESHGCVRLTNWDAARLAQMVSTKTKVIFQA